MDKRIDKVRKYCVRHRLIPAGAHILVGFSGGADSVCLLTMLKKLQPEYGLTLSAVHVHHGIRGEDAELDLAFARTYAEKLEVAFYEERVDVPKLAKEQGLTLEEAGRKARYDCFARLAEQLKADRIAVAHHQDDNAETILYQTLRGSSVRGLGGIRPRTGNIIRPLLGISRREIEEWLREQGISWQEDSTNQIPDVTRNKLRLELIPYIEREIQPGLKETLTQNGAYLAEVEDYLEEQTKALWEKWVRPVPEGIFLMEEFQEAHGALQKRLIFSCLAEAAGTRKDLGQVHVQACRELLDKQSGRKRVLPYELEAIRTYGGILFVKQGNAQRECFSEGMHSFTAKEISWEEYQHFQENDYTKCFDYDKINYCFILRKRQPKDRICVYRDGRSKKLQDFLVDRKVPARLRDDMSLLADGDQIVWIPGLRVSEAYKVTEETKRIIKVTIHHSEKMIEKQEEKNT